MKPSLAKISKWSELCVSALLAAYAVNEILSYRYPFQLFVSALCFYASYLYYDSFMLSVEIEVIKKERAMLDAADKILKQKMEDYEKENRK